MRAEGFSPALVQQSSEGNVQAVLRLPRKNQPQEQKAANALMVQLNRRWGDAKISGVIHAFRMGGFSNKKPDRDNAFTRILDAAGVVCGLATDMLAAVREKLRADRDAAKKRRRGDVAAQKPEAVLPAPIGRADDRFDAILKREIGLVHAKGWTENPSALDYRVAVAMIEEGFEREEIAGAMLRRSPDLEARHPNVSTYIDRTLDSAGRPKGRPDAIEDELEGPS